jgi:hypothetical protein
MNRPFKGVLLASVIVLVLGLGLIISGVAAGATWLDVGSVIFSNKYSYTGDVFGVNRVAFKGNKLIGESNILKDIDASKVEKLTLYISAGDVKIKESSGQYFQIDNAENRGDCFVEYNDNELTITIHGKYMGKGAKSTFWIPDNLLIDVVDIYADAGKVEADNLAAIDLAVEVAAGQLKTKNISATNLDIEIDAGEFKSEGKITSERASIRVAAGDIEVNLIESHETKLDVDVGSLQVEFVGKASDYNIYADNDIGELVIDGRKQKLSAEYNSQNTSGNAIIEVECNVGKAVVDFEDQ